METVADKAVDVRYSGGSALEGDHPNRENGLLYKSVPHLPRSIPMQVVKVVIWEENGAWLGYLQEYPDYWTQGETLEDLREHLKALYHEFISGQIPGIRRVEDLVVA